MLVSGGVAPVGAFVFSVAGKGGLRNNIEILCTLYPVFPIFVTLARYHRKDVDITLMVKIQNIYHHRSFLLPL